MVYDRSGQNNHGYFIGGATSSAKTIGKLGQALVFDGTSGGDGDDIVSLGTTAIITGTESAFSICAWVKISSLTPEQAIFVRGTDPGSPSGLFLLDANDGGTWTVETNNGGSWTVHNSDFTPTIGSWTHLCAAVSGSEISYYTNGVAGVADPYTPPASVAGLQQAIGAGWNNGGTPVSVLNGALDDVRIYNRALTAAEAKQLYQLGTVRVQQ